MLTIKVYPLSQSNFTSQVYAGLFDLSGSGVIKLDFIWRPKVKIHERNDWGSMRSHRIAYFEIWDRTKLISKVCFDMLDGPEIITLDGLEKCDIYFKRSYSSRYWATHHDIWQSKHPEYKDKIHPYGFNMPCDSIYEYRRARNMLTHRMATKLIIHEPVKSLRSVVRETLGRRKRQTIPTLLPNEPAQDMVLFQTRLFDPYHPGIGPHSNEVIELNKNRVAIIQALKDEFGKRFIGGLITNDYTIKHHPELITPQETSQKKYFELVQKCKIAVFSRGLRQSTGWRFPEYMAMSRCIVSEKLEYKVPIPLIDGKHYLTFTTPDECIDSCRKLLIDKDLAQKLRNNVYQYYLDNNTPKAIIQNAINTAIDVYNTKIGQLKSA